MEEPDLSSQSRRFENASRRDPDAHGFTTETFISGPYVGANKSTIQQTHKSMSVALGICTGAMSVKSAWGFLFYLVGFTATNILIHFYVCDGQAGGLLQDPLKELFVDGTLSNLGEFVRMWCLIYVLIEW